MAEAGPTDNGVAVIARGKYSASHACVQHQIFGVFWRPTGGVLHHAALLAACRSRADGRWFPNSA